MNTEKSDQNENNGERIAANAPKKKNIVLEVQNVKQTLTIRLRQGGQSNGKSSS